MALSHARMRPCFFVMKRIIYSIIFAIALLAGCERIEPADPVAEENLSESLELPQQEGMLRIKFDSETVARIESEGLEKFMEEFSGMGVYSMERLFPDAGEFESRQRQNGLHQWYRLYYKKEIVAETKAVQGVSELFSESLVETPRIIKPMTIPFDDEYSGWQWNLYNPGSIEGFVKGVDINVLPVWAHTGGIQDVIVNVVDTGIDIDHEDLKGVIIPGGPEGSKNFVDNSYHISDNFHGTHVSGIIAAINNNGKGVCGIAGGLDGNGGVRILNSQIFKDRYDGSVISTDDAGTAQAIVWGANHGALISQNSWGFFYMTEAEAMLDVNPRSLLDAIDYFIKYAGCDDEGNQVGLMKGGIVFFAAGNDAWRIGHPADYKEVVAVGAIGPSGKRTTYSNYGSWVDICAPGGDYEAFGVEESMIVSTGNSGQYYLAEGTSMACPHVSGVAALMISLFGGKGFTNTDLKDILLSGANKEYGVSDQIGPLLDAEGSREYYKKEESPIITTSYSGDYVVKGHETLTVDYHVYSSSDMLTISVDCGKGAVADIKDRSCSITFNDGSGKKTGKDKATIKVVSASGLTAEMVIEYEILENHPPVITKHYGDQILRKYGTSVTIDCGELFEDPDGGKIEYKSESSGNSVTTKCSDGEVTFRFKANGVNTIIITATDPCGSSTSQSFVVGCYDDSTAGPAAYPNPVVDILTICVGGSNETEVTLTSVTGMDLLSLKKICSILTPIQIDMSSFASGRYSLKIKYEGKEYAKTIVKK